MAGYRGLDFLLKEEGSFFDRQDMNRLAKVDGILRSNAAAPDR